VAWALPLIHIPAARTRFLILLIEVLEINNIKRAQTILTSGLIGNSFSLL
jgi:hypothetical protein